MIKAVGCAALLVLLGACATPRPRPADGDAVVAAAPDDEDSPEPEGCRPLFPSPGENTWKAAPRHSCWHRLWEVPAAIVVYPVVVVVALGAATAPIWAPILLLH